MNLIIRQDGQTLLKGELIKVEKNITLEFRGIVRIDSGELCSVYFAIIDGRDTPPNKFSSQTNEGGINNEFSES